MANNPATQPVALALALALGFAVAPTAAVAAPLPLEAERMISAAAEMGQLGPVADVARRTYPESVAEIDARVAELTKRAELERIDRIEGLRFREGWTGEGHAGGLLSSGNTHDVGVSGGLSFKKETLAWRHEARVEGEYQRSNGEISQERYLASYAGQRKLGGRSYVSLNLSGEHDRFAGFRSRFSESVGMGYRVVDQPRLRLGVEAGPALRQVDYFDTGEEIAFSARFAGDLSWTIRPDLVFTQNATAFLDSVSSSLTASTALTTKLRGDLSARASFDVRLESEPPLGSKGTDTTLRTSLVYDF